MKVLVTGKPPAQGTKVVVVGGTGFLGRHICEAFGAAGARVIPVSTSSAVRVDLTTAAGPGQLAALLAEYGADVVVNAAGRAWQANDQQMIDGNATLVDHLIEAVATQRWRPRLIHLGTVHEYGSGTLGSSTPEDQPARPVTPYGRSKLLATQSVLRASQTRGLDAVVLRVSNVAGPGTPRGSLLRMVADHLAEAAGIHANGGPIAELRFASLRAQRDFVDVRDVAEAVVAAAQASATDISGQIVNIGRGEAVRARWLVDRLVSLSGLRVRVVEGDAGGTPRTDVDWQQLDISKARQVLDWKPRRELDESLRDLLKSSLDLTEAA